MSVKAGIYLSVLSFALDVLSFGMENDKKILKAYITTLKQNVAWSCMLPLN